MPVALDGFGGRARHIHPYDRAERWPHMRRCKPLDVVSRRFAGAFAQPHVCGHPIRRCPVDRLRKRSPECW